MFASSYLSSSNVSVSHGSHGSPHNSAEQQSVALPDRGDRSWRVSASRPRKGISTSACSMTETSHLLPQFLLDQETGGKCSENREEDDLCQHFYTATWYLSESTKSSDSYLDSS